MKKLFIYMKEYRLQAVLGPLFKLLEASFELLVPFVIAAIIDKGIPSGDRSFIYRQCLILGALALIGMACSITAQYFAAKASVGFTKQIRRSLYSHIQSLSYEDIDKLGTPTLITRLTNDMNQVQTGMNLALRLLLRSPFVVVGAFIMSFIIDRKISAIFAATILVLAVIVTVIMYVCVPLYKRAQESLDSVMGATKETLSGSRVIRAFATEEGEIAEFQVRTDNLSNVQRTVGRISMLMNPLTYIAINFGIIALIWGGAIRVEMGILTQGAVVALYNYMSQILVELIKLANLIVTISKGIAGGNRISTVLDITPSLVMASDMPEVDRDHAASVEMAGVSFRYPGAAANVLTDLNFSVNKGETVGIIGGTGSGKSSLINLIMRFYDATSGEVLIDGINASDYPLDRLRSLMGIVPQEASLFKGTIRENMRWGKQDASDEEIWNALDVAQARQFVEEKDDKLGFALEQGGRNLSGGQRQRLTIARALVRDPHILILDDSASALDYVTESALRSALRTFSDHMTVFIVSQRASSIMHADMILVLDKGVLVGKGTHKDLLASCELYLEIYNTQFPPEAERGV